MEIEVRVLVKDIDTTVSKRLKNVISGCCESDVF